MTRRSRGAALFAVAALVGALISTNASAGGRPLTADLAHPTSGGSGTAALELNQGQGTVCWDIDLTGVAPLPGSGHIHDVATNGVILTLFGGPANAAPATTPSTPTAYPASACVDGVSEELIKTIRQSPTDYYVNLHNQPFPAGVVSGVLNK